MKFELSSEITITEPTQEIAKWVQEQLTVPNPDYATKLRLGLRLYKTPKNLKLYRIDGDNIIVPYGCIDSLKSAIVSNERHIDLSLKGRISYNARVNLYDYQRVAVKKMLDNTVGILNAPAGSGKTTMAHAIIFAKGLKTLWLTHTQDLLNQAYNTGARYTDKKLLGKITAGKVEIGSGITYATVQTMAKLDLNKYKYVWDMIIVDECHRTQGSELRRTQFSTCLNNLAARYKYGLTATVHRADGMEKAMFALIGNVKHIVPAESVADKIMKVKIQRVNTGVPFPDCLSFDGTMIYSRYISALAEDTSRNQVIANKLIENKNHFNLVLSDRLIQLELLKHMLPYELQREIAIIDGKTKKQLREDTLRLIRNGEKHYLFASYSLAKEGLDIPRLDRLYLATPQKDEAIVIQSVGRVARSFDGKEQPICYDFVDGFGMSEKFYKERCKSYRKCGCINEK